MTLLGNRMTWEELQELAAGYRRVMGSAGAARAIGMKNERDSAACVL